MTHPSGDAGGSPSRAAVSDRRLAIASLVGFVTAMFGIALAGPTPADDKPPTPPALSMSPAIAVTRVDGLGKYVPLEGARLTSEDKLKVYFQPLHFKVERTEAGLRAAFTEDGRVRRKGEKTPLSKEDKLLEHEQRFQEGDYQIYLVNTIGLKALPPGDYEFDIVLHDALDPGSSATQTLPFTIIPGPKPDPAAKADGPGEPESSTGPKSKTKPKAKAKAARSKKTAG